jgi:hypothetical protein
MKQLTFRILMIILLLSTGASFTSCKNKSKQNDTTTAPSTVDTNTTTTLAPAPNAPVTISPDDSLQTGLRDATKDFPGVNASVDNGVVTLTGEISRDRLPRLMQAVNSLHPKKVNNKLTVK